MADTPQVVAKFSTDEENKFVRNKRTNVKSDLIEITEDKLENILLKHINKLGIRRAWLTPLTLFATILLANATAAFGAKFGVDGAVWESLFLLLNIVTGIWFVVAIIRLVLNWEEASLDNLISIIKNTPRN